MKNISKVFILMLCVVLFAGCTLPGTQPQTTLPTDGQMSESQDTTKSEVAMENTTPYTLVEVALHNTPENCWFVIEGKVYDVTRFIESQKHPGGEAIFLGCGKDATELFNERPNGSGAHSDRAISMLDKFQIGLLSK